MFPELANLRRHGGVGVIPDQFDSLLSQNLRFFEQDLTGYNA